MAKSINNRVNDLEKKNVKSPKGYGVYYPPDDWDERRRGMVDAGGELMTEDEFKQRYPAGILFRITYDQTWGQK